MNSIEARIATIADIPAVLALQEKYLFANLNETEKKAGFVTTPFTYQQLIEVIGMEGLFVATDDTDIVAYCFSASWQYFSQWKIFEHMITLFPNYTFDGQIVTVDNSFQYGPICIDIPYRGKGIINILVDFMQTNMVKKYPIGITFINKLNIPSYKAHTKKTKWTVLSEFDFNNNKYYVLAMKM